MLGLDLAIFVAFVLSVGLATTGLETWGLGIFVVAIVLAALRGIVSAQPTQKNS